MNFKKVALLSFLLFMFLVPRIVLAGSFDEEIDIDNADVPVIDRVDFSSDTEFNNVVDLYMNDENVFDLKVIDTRGLSEDLLDLNDGSSIAPQRVLPYPKNVKYVGEVTRGTSAHRLATVSGNSGVTISLTNSWGVKASTNVSGPARAQSVIPMTLGFTIGRTYTVGYTGSYTVPSNAKSATLRAYPICDRWTYDIYERQGSFISGYRDVKIGNGSAYKPIGVHYHKSVSY